jgi:hypothetical protein
MRFIGHCRTTSARLVTAFQPVPGTLTSLDRLFFYVLSSNQGEFLTELIVFVDKTQYEGAATTGGITVETALQAREQNPPFLNFLGGFLDFFVLYSTLLHLPPLRFHCADGCWDRTQDRCS